MGEFRFSSRWYQHRVIRYADVLLMLAECEAEVGNSCTGCQLYQ